MRYDQDYLRDAVWAFALLARHNLITYFRSTPAEHQSTADAIAALNWAEASHEALHDPMIEIMKQSAFAAGQTLYVDPDDYVGYFTTLDMTVSFILERLGEYAIHIEEVLNDYLPLEDEEEFEEFVELTIGAKWFSDFFMQAFGRAFDSAPLMNLANFAQIHHTRSWITDNCPKHAEMNGVTIGPEAIFSANKVLVGYPGDPATTSFEDLFNCQCEMIFSPSLAERDGAISMTEVNKLMYQLTEIPERHVIETRIGGFCIEGTDKAVTDLLGQDLTDREFLRGVATIMLGQGEDHFEVARRLGVNPVDLALMTDTPTIEKVAKQFREFDSVDVLEVLNTIADTPESENSDVKYVTSSLSNDLGAFTMSTDSTDNTASADIDDITISGPTLTATDNFITLDSTSNQATLKLNNFDAVEQGQLAEGEVDGGGEETWQGVLVMEEVETGDGRILLEGSVSARELPLPLMLMTRNPEGGGGHDGAHIAGRIDDIWKEGNAIMGKGTFDMGSAAGVEANRLISDGVIRGVSVDLDMIAIEMDDDPMDMLFGDAAIKFTEARIMGATIVPFPAMQEASIWKDDAEPDVAVVASGDQEPELYRIAVQGTQALNDGSGRPTVRVFTPVESPAALIASGMDIPDAWVEAIVACGDKDQAPTHPPVAWFEKPELTSSRPLQVDPDGRVWGVVAGLGSCHIGFPGRCVTVPKESDMSFPYFHVGKVLTEEGTLVPTGGIVIDGTHPLDDKGRPDLRMGVDAAKAHYSTLDVVADVRLYWDKEFGIVAAGAIRPSATPEQIRALRGSNVSPDWRPVKNKRELVGLLSVPVSGFVDPDTELGLVASGGHVGWDVEHDEPLAAIGVNMLHREAMPFAAMEEHYGELQTRLEELERHVRILRSDRMMAKKVELERTDAGQALFQALYSEEIEAAEDHTSVEETD